MQEILWQLLNNLDFEKGKQTSTYMRSPWIDSGYRSEKILEKMPSPRIFKSHLNIELLPENLNKRARVTKFWYAKVPLGQIPNTGKLG